MTLWLRSKKWKPREPREKIHSQDRQTKKTQNLLTLLIILFFGTSILIKIGGNIWIQKRLREMGITKRFDEYTYLLNDHPPSWPISRGNVLMAFDNPKRYALETSQGELEWSSLIPSSSSSSPNGLVYLGKYRQPYTISMFHQLKCLDIVRAETVRDRERDRDVGGHEGQVREGEGGEGREERKALARHCLNYLRQMVTCRADLELESFQYASHRSPIDLHGVYECKDWSRVYEEVEKNQREHEEWLMKRTTKTKTM